MTAVDGLFLVILAISSLLSLKRGFVKEVLSLLNWVLALLLARFLGDEVAELFSDSLSEPVYRQMLAYVLVFFGTLFFGMFLSRSIAELIRSSPLMNFDKAFGVLFGIARGGVIVMVLVYGVNMTSLSDAGWWHQSKLLPHIEFIEVWLAQEASDVDVSEVQALLKPTFMK